MNKPSYKLRKNDKPCVTCHSNYFELVKDNGDDTYTWECKVCRLPRILWCKGD